MSVEIDTERLTEILQTLDVREPGDLWQPLRQAAEEFDDTATESGMRVLSDVMSYYAANEERHTPYRACVVMDGKRSAEPEDLTDDELSALEEALPHISEPVAQARIADVLWLRRRNPDCAVQAIQAYLKSASELESTDDWTFCNDAIQRAANLAAVLKRGRPEQLNSVLDHCHQVLERIAGSDRLYLTLRLIEIFVQHDSGDLREHATIAQGTALAAEADGDHSRARAYWNMIVKIGRRLKDEEMTQGALKAIAESYHSEGMSCGNALARTHFLEKAIVACNDVKGSTARRDEIHRTLIEAQQGVHESLQPVTLPDDLLKQREDTVRKCEKETIDRLDGMNTLDALIALGFELFSPLDFAKLREQTREIDQKSILSTIAPASLIDNRGRTVARSDMSGEEDAATHTLARNANIERDLICGGIIYPALELIERDHHVSEKYVYEQIVAQSPFVPSSNIAIVSKGLWMGLMRDFVGATTILVPQLEECIRHVMQESGVRISTLGADEVEKYRHLPTILKLDEVRQTFGNDTVDDLSLLLVEPQGGNIRAAVAHGFIDDATCYGPECIFVWWHMLRLTLLPIAVASRRSKKV